MHRFFVLAIVLAVITCCPPAEAQTYVVSSDTAKFMNGEEVVASVPPGTRLWVLEKKDGWLNAVEPQSLELAWIHESDVERKQYSSTERQTAVGLLDELKAIELIVNSDSPSAEGYAKTREWAEAITAIFADAHPMSGTSTRYAGLVARKLDAYAAARTHFERALTMRQLVYGRGSAKAAQVHLELAELLIASAQLVDAIQHAKEAARINSVLLGADHPDTAESFLYVAQAMESISEFEDAGQYYRKVVDSYRTHFGADDERTIRIAAREAFLQAQHGSRAKGMEAFADVVRRAKGLADADQGWLGMLELDLAFLQLNLTSATDVGQFREQLASHRKRFPSDSRSTLERERQLVRSMLISGEQEQVFVLLDDTLRQLRRTIRTGLWGMSAAEQSDYLSYEDGGRFFQALDLATGSRSDEDVVRMSAEWLINGKGLVREAQTVQAGTVADLAKRDQWAAEEYVTHEAVIAALPEHSAFVDVVRFPQTDFDSGEVTPRYAAWICRKDGSVRLVELGDAERIDEAIAVLLAALADSATRIGVVGEPEAFRLMEDELKEVSRQLWQPIIEVCDTEKVLVISPDQATWLLPWSAMLNTDGTYAIEQYQLQLELSGRDLVQQQVERNSRNAVIFADPDFGVATPDPSPRRSPALGIQLAPVGRLMYSAQEATAVSPSIEQLLGSRPEVLLAGEAREAEFKSLSSPGIVMLSTHGFFLNPDGTHQTEQEGRRNSDREESGSLRVDPLLQCGLMLANANEHTAIDRLENDGVLTGAEIAAVDLSGTQLAVLSACQTGIGALEATGGVVGLRRAFHVAGVKSVLATLWPIEDLETAYLMKDFFGVLADSSDVRVALQSAQQKTINRHRRQYGAAHPHYWAAFNLSGHAGF